MKTSNITDFIQAELAKHSKAYKRFHDGSLNIPDAAKVSMTIGRFNSNLEKLNGGELSQEEMNRLKIANPFCKRKTSYEISGSTRGDLVLEVIY